MQVVERIKAPNNNCRNRSKGLPLRGDSTKKWKFSILGARSHSREPIDVKYCMTMRTHICPSALPNFT